MKLKQERLDAATQYSINFKLIFSILFLTLLLLPCTALCADEWNKGGNLHQASVRRWMKASDANRLATSADWFMAMTRESNKPLLVELKAMDEVDYQAAFRYYAARLESCVSEKIQKKSVRPEDRVSIYAEKCYQVLHGGDSL